jgi:hypothetical protein
MAASGDKRFAALQTDPRFARFSHQRNRVTIDDRFKGARRHSSHNADDLRVLWLE